MGEFFKSAEELFRVFRAFWNRVAGDPVLIPRLKNKDMVLRLTCSDPDASFTVHLGDPGLPDDRCLSFEASDDKPVDGHKPPHAVMTFTADFQHRFWCGVEHPGTAVVNGKIKASGNYIRALALIPIIRPVFRTYRDILAELGMRDLALVKSDS